KHRSLTSTMSFISMPAAPGNHDPLMLRRAHVPHLRTGRLNLPDSEAHHVRDVLRMADGDILEVFDNASRVARAIIVSCTSAAVTVQIDRIEQPADSFILTLASALPKGDRADWMIE